MEKKNFNSEKVFDYFICYCGADMENNKFMTNEFAQTLYKQLSACGKRVYFAPENGSGDAYNNKKMLKKRISKLTTSFIVLLSPNFFNDFDEETGNNESPIKKELSIALAEAKARQTNLQTETTDFIRYVHIDGFKWGNPHKTFLEKLFPEYHFDEYFDIAAFTQTDLPVEESVKLFIEKNLNIDVEREQSIKQYRQDMNLCFHCMIEHSKQIPLNLFLKSAQTENLTNNVENMLQHLGLVCSDINKAELTYWPVYFSDINDCQPTNNKDISYSTCAICFGALQILHWLSDDQKLIAEDNNVKLYRQAKEYFYKSLHNAIKLLIIIRNENGTWPTKKQINNNLSTDDFSSVEELNETTLSISTLLKSEFLDKSSAVFGTSTDDILENRFRFLLKSIGWILKDASHNEKDEVIYWNLPLLQEGSALMTSICLDTLIKFMQDTYVRKHIQDSYVKEYIGSIDFNKIFQKILCFLESVQNKDGGIRPSLDEKKSSFSHTAKVMNSVITFWSFTNDANCKEKAVDIINGCFYYLINLIKDHDFVSLFDMRKANKFEYFNIPQKEFYEMSGELMVVTSIIKVIEIDHNRLTRMLNHEKFSWLFSTTEQERVTNLLVSLLNDYREKHIVSYFDFSATESILIRGRRKETDKQFPIYMLYYYRMALTDLLRHLINLHNKEKD